MRGQSALHSKASDLWGTPHEVFAKYHKQYQFTIDASADVTNHLLPRWYGPGSSITEDALSVSWEGERCWLNPPYSHIYDFVQKARGESLHHGVPTVMLIPSRTDTRYWHKYIWDENENTWQSGVAGHFLRGRLKFRCTSGTIAEVAQSAPFPSVVIIFDSH